MKRPHASRLELVSLWLALLILASVAAFAYTRIDAAADTLGWVEHTDQVLQQLQDVTAAYGRSTTARRAYVVAGDESGLADAHELDTHLHHTVAVVRASILDNPSQLRRMDTLSHLFDQRLAGLDAAVEQRRRSGASAETTDDLLLAKRIREAREAFEAEESRLLAERDARTRRDITTTKVAEVLGTFVSAVMLLLAFGRLRHEVAGRRRSETALRVSERFLDSIVENLPAMIFVKEAGELRFERINRAGEDLLGIDRKELVGKNDFDFFPRDQAEFFQSRDRETLASRSVVSIPEEPIQTKRGERWLHTKKVPVLDEQGIPKFLLGISEDITERREDAAALKAAKDAAEAANKELESFSYSVAHDLRAPLRAIDGFSQALEEDAAGELDAVSVEHLRRVRAATGQMARLIDGLLGLSRLTRGELAREKVDLTALAQQSITRLREAHPGREVEVVIKEGLSAEGDPRLLGAAFDNLLGNAWKFTSKTPRPRIEVGSRPEDGSVVFFVRDNGAGFEQAYVDKLFGAFQRLHSVQEFEGSGIGLATVQRIVRRHGGRIWAEGEVGRGATFHFTL